MITGLFIFLITSPLMRNEFFLNLMLSESIVVLWRSNANFSSGFLYGLIGFYFLKKPKFLEVKA